MNKKKIIILIMIFLSLITVTISWIFYNTYIEDYDYNKAKKEVTIFLEKNLTNLEKISKECLTKKDDEIHKFKDKEYRYSFFHYKDCVIIDIGAQGMLGGQYWALVYCEDDILDGKSIDIQGEYIDDLSGKNIFIVEKIKDNWYFSYDDYDGKVNTTLMKK